MVAYILGAFLGETTKEVNILANETGKRYSCGKCGSEFVVTRGADGTVSCCGEPMSQK